MSGRNRFDRTYIINLAEFISLCILSLNQNGEWNDRRRSGSLDSTLFPRKQWNEITWQVFWLIPVTTPSRFSPVAEIVDPSCVRFRTGTYSSGNCCRLSRHSLLIDRRPYGLLSEPLRGKDTKFTSNKKCFYFLLVCVVLYWSLCLYQYVASPRHSFRSLYKYPVANIVKIDNTVRNTIVLRTIGGCLR